MKNTAAMSTGMRGLVASVALAATLAITGAAAAPHAAEAKTTKPATVAITSVKAYSTSATVKVKKVKGAFGYQVAAYKDGKGKAVTSSGWSTKVTCGNLLDGERYTVKARAFKMSQSGKRVYGSWSKAKSLKTSQITYTISYNPAGGAMPAGEVPTTFTRVTPTFSLPTPTYANRDFLGWYTVEYKYSGPYQVAIPRNITEVEKGTTRSLELSAVWSLPKQPGTDPGTGGGSESGGVGGGDNPSGGNTGGSTGGSDNPGGDASGDGNTGSGDNGNSSGGNEGAGSEAGGSTGSSCWLTMDMIENSEKLLVLDEATRSAAIEGMASKLYKPDVLSGRAGVRVGSVSADERAATVGFSKGLKGWPVTGFEMTISGGNATISPCSHASISTARAYRDFEMESADRYNAMIDGYIFTTSGFSYNPATCSWVKYDKNDIIYGDNCNEWLYDYIFGSYGTAWFTGVPVLEERCDLCGADTNPDYGCNNELGNYVAGGERPYYYVGAPGSMVASHGAYTFTESSWIDPVAAAADRNSSAIRESGI